MRAYSRCLPLLAALLIAGAAWAQEQRPGWLGVDLHDVTKEEADKLGWEAPRGVKVIRPVDGSPAAEAGLQPGDVIATLDGVEVENIKGLTAALMAKGAGTQVKLRVMRAGKERTVTATLGVSPAAMLAETAKAPQLMLDTGGHMSMVRGLAITPDGKQLVSASEDTTIRVWDIETGKTVRIIRGEAVPGYWGTIYAMGLSPDGRWLAVGGFLHNSDIPLASAVRLYDFASGKMAALLKGHHDVVAALAFSPDSKRLISGSADKTAIIWDLTKRQQVLRLSGHTEWIKAVAFTSDGDRVITGGEDETLRLWSAADGKLIAEMTEHKLAAQREAAKRDAERRDGNKSTPWDAGVETVAVSPAEQLIASGSADGRILLWDGQTGAFLRQHARPGGVRGNSAVYSVTFSRDSRWLLFTSVSRGCQITEVATGRELYDGALHEKPLHWSESVDCAGPTVFSPDGRLAAAVHGSNIRLLDARTRRTVRTLQGSGQIVWGVGFAREGRSITWGNVLEEMRPPPPVKPPWPAPKEIRESDEEALDRLTQVPRRLTRRMPLPFDGKLLGSIGEIDRESGLQGAPGDVRASRRHGSLSVYFKKLERPLSDTRYLHILKDGNFHSEIDLGRPAAGNARMTFLPDGQTIMIGLTPEIRAFDLHGRLVGEFKGHNGQVRDLAPSPDGRFLVSGGVDQTVRLWNLKTRELIVTLFHGTDGEWVMWTPQGYYTGSPGADKIVGWQINKGPEEVADYVGADQLRQHLHRPDIVEKAIVLASAAEAVRQAPGTSFKLADLLARPVPRFRVAWPATGSVVRGGRAAVRIAIDATPDAVRMIRVQINGRQVAEETPKVGSGGFGVGERVLDVPLGQGRNEVHIALTNAVGEKVEMLVLNHEGGGELDKRGTLHILAIGVNEYKGLGNTCGGASCDLRYSVADARRMAEAIEQRLGLGHARVVKRLLVNGGDGKDVPTAANIIDAVELLRQAEESDTVVLFVAGHGVNEGPDYRFLPTNAERTSEGTGWSLRGSTVVPWQVLQSAVEAAKGRRILFVDTCHSGNAYNQRLGNAAYHANIIAYTAARFDQEAMEDPALGHGLFTYAVVEGLDGKGDLGAKRQISTKDLAAYVVSRVSALAKAMNGQQEPQYFRGRDAEDYVLAQW